VSATSALNAGPECPALGSLARSICDEDGIARALAPVVCRGDCHLVYKVRHLGPEIVIRVRGRAAIVRNNVC
jgi:hypothetical protein